MSFAHIFPHLPKANRPSDLLVSPWSNVGRPKINLFLGLLGRVSDVRAQVHVSFFALTAEKGVCQTAEIFPRPADPKAANSGLCPRIARQVLSGAERMAQAAGSEGGAAAVSGGARSARGFRSVEGPEVRSAWAFFLSFFLGLVGGVPQNRGEHALLDGSFFLLFFRFFGRKLRTRSIEGISLSGDPLFERVFWLLAVLGP